MDRDFIWGAATASYQIEGAAQEDGKGASIWDVFSHEPGRIKNGDNGDIACDAYHRWEEDLDLLQRLGIRHYRFSVSWPRVIPAGDGAVNAAGLAYYDRIVDGCLARGIEPWLTLFHWDLPQSLQERFGGWRGRETAEAFGRYADIVASHFRGRVRRWFILNEPQCFIMLGYGSGEHAPGLRLADGELFACWHNALVAYGLAAQAIRTADGAARIGVASTGRICYPQTPEEADVAAARCATFDTGESAWRYSHPMLLDPICLGRYPDTDDPVLAGEIARVSGDMDTIFRKPDFIGLNIYNGICVRSDPSGQPELVPEYAGYPRTACKWPITPAVMRYGPLFFGERYGLPIYISENGQSCNDRIFLDGRVHDPDRIDFLSAYLRELRGGIDMGAPVKGYFHWSFLDNFEWASGYEERFGLVYVDYPAGRRIPKDSAAWYSRIIKDPQILFDTVKCRFP